MAFLLRIGSTESDVSLATPITEFSVQEAATPLSATDSSGQAGSISISIPKPDRHLDPNNLIIQRGASYLVGKYLRLDDSRKGFTLGKVSEVSESRESGTIQLSCVSRLGSLIVHDAQAQPFVGTLYAAVQEYLALAEVTTGFLVDPAIATQPVVFPGWTGDLWYHLKQMAAAIDCDISLVSGVILVRPIRRRVATRGRDTNRSFSAGGGSLSQFVEVNQYNNRPITNELVYPPGGWSEEVTVINVNAGETVEETLELSASVSSIVQPTMQTFVSRLHDSSSVFTVVGDDGLPIQPQQWEDQGGSLRVEINPDTVSLTVHITAPAGIANKDGSLISVYGIALSSDSDTGRYSTLRIIGSGVAFNKETVRIPTGITPSESASEVGATVDNPFLSTRDEVCTAGVRAIRSFNGSEMTLSGSVVAINQRGDTGEVQLRTYAEFQAEHAGRTYAQVQTLLSGQDYLKVQEDFNAGIPDEFENQVFGNAAGARIWDEESRRWFRIRNATFTPDLISFDAEDDLTHSDMDDVLFGTYGEVQSQYSGMSYRDVDFLGMRPIPAPAGPPLFPSSDLFPALDLFPSGG